jgi:hypothetical protein
MLNAWMSIEYKKVVGNEHEWKKTQGQTMHTIDRRSKERCGEDGTRLEDSR